MTRAATAEARHATVVRIKSDITRYLACYKSAFTRGDTINALRWCDQIDAAIDELRRLGAS